MAIWHLAQEIEDREKALDIKSRHIWNARPREATRSRPKPAKHVFCAYSRKMIHEKPWLNARKPTSFDVIGELQYTQTGDTHLKEPDIRYNFMIGGDEVIYEGRGWNHCAKLPGRYRYYTLEALYIGYIGNFKDEGPSQKMFELRDELIWIGVMRNFISPVFTLWQLATPDNYQSDFKKYITI